MSILQLIVNESTRKLSNRSSNQVFVVNDANVDTIRFSIPAGFSDIDIDENASFRVMYIPPGIDKTVYAKTLTFVQNDGVYISYDWQVGPNVLVESGILTVSFCILKTGSEVQEWHTIPYTIPVSNTIHTDDSDEGDETITPTVAQRVAVLESMIQRVASGSPIVVSSTSAMTDTDQIYVLSTNGEWYYHNGSSWVAGGEYGAVSTDTTLTQSGIPADAKATGDAIDNITLPVDATLTQTGQAADAKVVGDKLTDLQRYATSLVALDMITFPDTWENGKSINASGEVINTSNSRISGLIEVHSGSYVYLFANITNTTDYNTRVHGYNANGEWVKQLNMIGTRKMGQIIHMPFTVDDGISYIRISMSTLLKPYGIIEEPYIDSLLKDIIGIKLVQFDGNNANLIYDDNGQLVSNNNGILSYPVDVSGKVTLVIKDIETYQAGFNIKVSGFYGNTFVRTLYKKKAVLGDTIITFNIPDDVNNVVVGIRSPQYRQQIAFFINGSFSNGTYDLYSAINGITINENEIEKEALALGLHSVPESRGVLNTIKRARQMTDIVWTPSGEIPRAFMGTGETYLTSHSVTYRGVFANGKEYKGLPYTLNALVGQDVSFETFVTSVTNPDSVEIAGSEYISSDKPSTYGTVCTGLTAYALELPYIVSNYWPSVDGLSLVGAVDSLEYSSYKLGDILQINGHCAIVTDIDNNLGRIEISESTRQGGTCRKNTDGKFGSLCRRVFMGFAEFKSWFSGFSLYRYEYIDSVSYTPTKFSPMINEGTPLAYDTLPIVPYMGNKASFSTYSAGPTVRLLIADTGYTHVVVLKDGQPYNEDGTSNPYPINETGYIDVTCAQEESIYNAYLIVKNGSAITSSSVWCTWSCRPYFNPTVSVANGIATFSFTVKSNNYKPFFVSFGSNAPRYGNFIRVFDYQTSDNENGTTTYTFTVPYPGANPTTGQLAFMSTEFGMGQLTWHLT